MKLYIAVLMILMCDYATAVEPQQPDTASISVLAQDFESKANTSMNTADKFQDIGLRSVAEKYQALAEQYQVMVNICQNITCNTKTSLRDWLASHEIRETQFNEHIRLTNGYRGLASAHEDVVTEIQATGYQGPIIRKHQELSNKYKKQAALVGGLLNVTALEGNELKGQMEILAVTESWIEAHSNFSRFLETINKPLFVKGLNDLEKTAVNRMIAYNEINELNKTLRANDLTAMKEQPFSDMIQTSQMAAEKVKEADRAYIEAHPKGKEATATDWIDILNILDKKVLNFHQEGGCHNEFI